MQQQCVKMCERRQHCGVTQITLAARRRQHNSTTTVLSGIPHILIRADLVIVQIALLPSAGHGPAAEFEALAAMALHREMTHDDVAADPGVSDTALDAYVVLQGGETVAPVVGISVREAILRLRGGG